MIPNFDRFSPAAWHDGGVYSVPKSPAKPAATTPRPPSSSALKAVVFALASFSALSGEVIALRERPTHAAGSKKISPSNKQASASKSADHIDPVKWSKVMTLLRDAKPADDTDDDIDPEPFV